MNYLYRYETKGIQNWILSSNKLRDLAGGSALVESLTSTARRTAEALGAEVLQATSGAMTAKFSDKETLEKFASEWPMQVALRAPGLQLVQAWIEDCKERAPLYEALAAKRNLVSVTELKVNPWVVRAGQSGLPALERSGRSAARSTVQDFISLAREWAFTDNKKQGEDLVVTGGREWEHFEAALEDWDSGNGPVAVIHADGSGIGQALINTETNDLKAFSEALRKATSAAVKSALEEVTPSLNNALCARPVVSAGDDLTYIVLAKDARRFCQAWLRTFEKETLELKDKLGGKGLSGGAGIAIVNRNYPFSSAYALAEKLCKAAKDRVKKDKPNSSVICFKRITNSLVDDLSKDAVGWIVSSDSTRALVDLVAAVHELPRGSLRTWLDHFQRRDGQAQAKRLWARAAEVAEPEIWRRFTKALTACGADAKTGELPKEATIAALTLGEERTTPLVDAMLLRRIESKPQKSELKDEEVVVGV